MSRPLSLTLLALLACALLPTGCVKKGPVTEHCANNVNLQMKRIDDIHAKFQSEGAEATKIYWARDYLEAARYVLDGKGGVNGSGAPCTDADRKVSGWHDLKKAFEKRSSLVEEMEKAKGVEFKGVTSDGFKWMWIKDGRDVDHDTANNL